MQTYQHQQIPITGRIPNQTNQGNPIALASKMNMGARYEASTPYSMRLMSMPAEQHQSNERLEIVHPEGERSEHDFKIKNGASINNITIV